MARVKINLSLPMTTWTEKTSFCSPEDFEDENKKTQEIKLYVRNWDEPED